MIKKVDLSSIRDIDIKSITVRSVNGEDTLDAAVRVVPGEGQQIDGNIFNIMMRQHMIAQSITEVDGKAVTGPCCLESLRWSARTREFVGEIYDFVNGVDPKERENFMKALAGGTPAQ
jgi:hypothetical protein